MANQPPEVCIEPPLTPVRIIRMGVLHIPVPSSLPLPSSLAPRFPRPRPAVPVRITPAAPEAVAFDSPMMQPAQQGTLLPASLEFETRAKPQTQKVEIPLERSPQQLAEQEATMKLVRQCISGEQQAWQQLVASQHRRIYGICYRFTNSASDAEDLTQDVFIKVYKNLDSYDLTKGSFQTWMTTLARNLLVDHFRRTRLDRASDSLDASLGSDEDGRSLGDRLVDTGISQEKHVAGLELKAAIEDALKQLSPELREAVILRDLEDMDYKDIAQVLRIPEGTVKSRISRGRGELARLLQRMERQVM